MSAEHSGTNAGEILSTTRNDSNDNPLERTTEDGTTYLSSHEGSHIHVWAEAGDDTIHIAFENLGSYTKGHHVRGDQKRFSEGLFHDDFVFQDLHEIHGGAIVVGRIEDYDGSRDHIFIEDEELDLTQGFGRAKGYDWKVVKFDADSRDSAVTNQQWLLIDTGGGYAFYALEGARVTPDGSGGANGGDQEDHFPKFNATDQENYAQNIWSLAAVSYVDPVNHVPFGHAPQGGSIINDYDDDGSDLGVLEGSTSGDLIAAGLNDDMVSALGGNDKVWGGSGDDTLTGGIGDDTLIGGPGVDTATYSGNQASYTLTLSPTATTLTDRRPDGNGTDTLVEMEFLDFETEIPAFDGNRMNLEFLGGPMALTEENFSDLIELYIAYFNRAPDALGLYSWATAYSNGQSLEDIATEFLDQDETRTLYPDGTPNSVFLDDVYNNVLGRSPDQGGFDFWLAALDSGAVGRDEFIVNFLGGAQGSDVSFLDRKVDIGTYFAVTKGMSNGADVVMDLFDGSQASLQEAVAATDQLHSEALDPDNGEFLMPLLGVLDDPFSGV